jgi:hypothetical protein
MIEVAGAILLAVLVLIYVGGFVVVAALLFGLLLVGVAGALLHFLRVPPGELAWGIVAASVLIGAITREAVDESTRDT